MPPPLEVILQENQNLKQENAALKAQVDWLKRQVFGPGKGEKLDRAQLLLALAAGGEPPPDPPREVAGYERHKKSPPKPRPAPAEQFAHLPVEETVEVVPDEVKAAPELFERIGQEETFEVDIHPPRLFRRLLVRPKFRHLIERSRPPLVAPAPARAVPGGYASAGLLAWVVVSKYVDHLPLHRQEKMLGRWGAPIGRKTTSDWVELVAGWLKPIYNRMRQEVLGGGYIQVDETPVRYNDKDRKNGRTDQGQMWVVGRPGGDVLFHWRLTRRHGELGGILGGFEAGVLQSDGYDAYRAYAQDRPGVVRAGCWAHARRKFVEAAAEDPAGAGLVLNLIGHLYAMEGGWDRGGLRGPALRAALRAGAFGPTLALLKRVAIKLAGRSLPKSGIGKACAYLLGQWDALVAHLEHGQTRLDNNLLENAIRPTALGKNHAELRVMRSRGGFRVGETVCRRLRSPAAGARVKAGQLFTGGVQDGSVRRIGDRASTTRPRPHGGERARHNLRPVHPLVGRAGSLHPHLPVLYPFRRTFRNVATV